jgi:hemerythrin-like domain-containing protein
MVYAVDHGAVLQREQFLSLAREYIDMQMRHMRIEETSIFPLVEEKLSIPDWKHIIKKSPAGNDPLFDKSNPPHFDVLTTWIEKPQEPIEP